MRVGEVWEPKIKKVNDNLIGFSKELEDELISKVKIRGIVGDLVGIQYIDLNEQGVYDIFYINDFLTRYKKVYE